ncbi:unnamed protein product [Ceutorhynchus assimilis]|uniref:Uncharacterized protein n=1 Tax=Ceutorhynchus assimilis TaxID=467358 RepID=A0A9N9MEE8_9CUCU|nr:unnamed protein product [Ceutorhynchus assimilis]
MTNKININRNILLHSYTFPKNYRGEQFETFSIEKGQLEVHHTRISNGSNNHMKSSWT